MRDNLFEQLDFGAFKEYINDDDITDISYTNNGQIWVRSLSNGSYRVENDKLNNALVEKLAFQCSNVMGTSFNNANPFLDAESPELRMNFVHDSIATNGIALVIRKTPAKIRLKKENLLNEDYVTKDVHDFLIKCVLGHCNIIVCGETGSGKTEFVKYLASHTKESEKIITIEDTLELHLDKIYPNRDIVAMKTNNIASYSEVLVTCMRQNPKWILLSEVRSAEAVSAVRNSISSGHNILSTIHSDKAHAIPHRMYSLMETDLDVEQFLNTIYRYVQLGVHIKAYYSKERGKFHREIDEITEFYIDEDNNPVYNIIYQKNMLGEIKKKQPSAHLMEYLEGQNIDVNSPLEEDNGLNINDLGKTAEEVKEEATVQEVVNPAVASVQASINNVMPKVEDPISNQENNSILNTTSEMISNSVINPEVNQMPDQVQNSTINPMVNSVNQQIPIQNVGSVSEQDSSINSTSNPIPSELSIPDGNLIFNNMPEQVQNSEVTPVVNTVSEQVSNSEVNPVAVSATVQEAIPVTNPMPDLLASASNNQVGQVTNEPVINTNVQQSNSVNPILNNIGPIMPNMNIPQDNQLPNE